MIIDEGVHARLMADPVEVAAVEGSALFGQPGSGWAHAAGLRRAVRRQSSRVPSEGR